MVEAGYSPGWFSLPTIPHAPCGVPKSGPLPNFTSNWYVIWNKSLASFNLSFPFHTLKRPQESPRFINSRQWKPNRTVFACWKDDLAPSWVINRLFKKLARELPLQSKISQKIPKSSCWSLGRGWRGTGVWSVWEKQGTSRNPWKVPEIAFMAVSPKQRWNSACDLGRCVKCF